MSRHPRRSIALLLLSAILSWGCEGRPKSLEVPRDGDVCDRLAQVFYMVGVNKDRGDSLREQLEKAHAGVANPFSAQPGKTVRYWERVIELVYRRPSARAGDTRALARSSCTINDQGQAVLLWPKE